MAILGVVKKPKAGHQLLFLLSEHNLDRKASNLISHGVSILHQRYDEFTLTTTETVSLPPVICSRVDFFSKVQSLLDASDPNLLEVVYVGE